MGKFIERYENIDWPQQTHRVYLRPLQAEDKAALFEVVKHPEVAKGNPWQSPENIQNFDFSWGEKQSYFGKELAFCDNDTGSVIGSGGVYIDEEHHKARLGYILHPPYWNQGYMTEIVKLLTSIAFERVGLHRVEATVYSFNQASSRVLEKAGYQYEGRQHEAYFIKGEYVSLDMYGLRKKHWKQNL